MKKIIVLTLLVLMFAVPVNASQMVFKLTQANYPIYVNNQELKSDLPILSYNGNTYIPLRKVSDATGNNINWDDVSKSVYISKNVDDKIYDKIKCYSSVMNIYKELIDFGNLLHDLYVLENTNVTSITLGTNKEELTKLNEYYDYDVTLFNTLISRLDLIDRSCKQNNIYETENFNITIACYKDVLNNHSLSILNILKYSSNQSIENYNNYSTVGLQAETQSNKTIDFCNNRYKEYFNKILLYENEGN